MGKVADPLKRGKMPDWCAEKGDISPFRGHQPEHELDQGTLSRTVRTNYPQIVAGLQPEGNILQDLDATTVTEPHPLDSQEIFRHSGSFPTLFELSCFCSKIFSMHLNGSLSPNRPPYPETSRADRCTKD